MTIELIEHIEPNTLRDQITCKNIADTLERHYPGWEWLVGVEHGVIRVHSMKLDGQFGFTILPDQIDNDYIVVRNMGGQLLERYGMPRGPFNYEVYRQRCQWEITNKGLRVKGDRTPDKLPRTFI